MGRPGRRTWCSTTRIRWERPSPNAAPPAAAVERQAASGVATSRSPATELDPTGIFCSPAACEPAPSREAEEGEDALGDHRKRADRAPGVSLADQAIH